MFEQLRSLLENQFLSGGLVLMALGTVLMLIRSYALQLLRWLLRQFIVEIEIRNSSPAFEWFSDWLHVLPYASRSRRLTVVAARRRSQQSHRPGAAEDTFRVVFTPAPGNHVFMYGGRPIWLRRVRDEGKAAGGDESLLSALRERETLHFRVFGRSQARARKLVLDAKAASDRAAESEPRIMVSTYGYWTQRGNLRDRSLDSVILPGDQAELVMRDAERFLSSRKWYSDRGIPYRRGYLLAGITGSGKTSLVAALAAALRLELYVLNLSGYMMSDDRLMDLMASVPEGAMLLIEDVDAATHKREKESTGRKQKRTKTGEEVSLSALLNIIDGVAAPEGCLVFMTTNYPDRLDDALVRPGRMDMRIDFDYATQDQVTRIFHRFFGPGNARPQLDGKKVTMADVQEILVRHRDDPTRAMTALSSRVPQYLAQQRGEVLHDGEQH